MRWLSAMSQVRRIDCNKYPYDDPRRYVTAKDCLTEPEVLRVYCENHPEAVCLGGYFYFGCRPEEKKREDFVRYDKRTGITARVNGKILKHDETYCGRKIPRRVCKGKTYLENQIWNRSGLGHPDLIDGNIIIEAKGGIPSLQKVKTAFGQLVFYKEHESSFDVAFLFPKVWLEAENLQTAFSILKTHQIALIPVSNK
jgi:hypothetical protein